MNIQDHLPILQSSAAFHANRLGRRLNLPAAEHEDLGQDLLVEMVARLRWFDPNRASLSTFIDLIARHGAHAIARRHLRERRLFGEAPFGALSL